MNIEEKKDILGGVDEQLLLADGYEAALIGYGQQFNNTFAVYDRSKCIQILIDRDGMTYEEANEYFEFNTVGAWMGVHTPAFMEFFEADQQPEQEKSLTPRTRVEVNADLAALTAQMEPLHKRARVLEAELHDLRLKECGVAVGDIVMARPPGLGSCAYQEALIRSIDLRFGENDKPWLTVSFRKKNGEWADRENNVYKNWEKKT